MNIDYDALAVALLKHNGSPSVKALLGVAGESGVLSAASSGVTGVDGPGVSVSVGGEAVVEGTVAAGGVVGESGVEKACGEGVDGAWNVVGVVGQVSDEGERSGSETSSSSLSGGSPGVVSDAVKASVAFGGFADGLAGVDQVEKSGGFYRNVVRGANVVALKREIEKVCGCKLPKMAMRDLLVCTFAAGAMPDSVDGGKARLRSLAAIGDASVTLHLSVHALSAGKSVEWLQGERSKRTSDAFFREIMKNRAWSGLMTFPPGVDAGTATSAATAFEAVVGVLTLYREVAVVRAFLTRVGVLV